MGIVLPFPPKETQQLHRFLELWTTTPEADHQYGFDTCEGWTHNKEDQRVVQFTYPFWDEEYEMRVALPIELAASPVFINNLIQGLSAMHSMAVQEEPWI